MVRVFNREELEARFGGWPSFHDAEILAVRLDSGQRGDGRPSIELDIHVFAVDGVLPSGKLNFARHTLATFRFEGVEQIDLKDFGPQNVLDELILEELRSPPGAAKTRVSLPSNNGLGGGFNCEETMVVAVADYEPGIHSVYYRTND